MKMKIFFLGLLCLFFRASAQENIDNNISNKNNLTGLQIGDRVPDAVLQTLADGKDGLVKLSDFRGKLLILDFWATWCLPCVAMIPKIDTLQKQFNGRVQFLPVAYQSAAEVSLFYKKLSQQKGRGSALPQVVGDTVLVRLFPHAYLPHYVWIGADGTVKAITSFTDVTAKNITRMLSSSGLQVREKQDEVIAYDPSEPLFFSGAVSGSASGAASGSGSGSGEVLMRSQLSGYRAGVGRGLYKDVDIDDREPTRRITLRNVTILDLFRLAYLKEQKETLLEVADRGQLELRGAAPADYGDWLKEGHGYCYELLLPESERQKAYGLMQEQLKSYFSQYAVGLEKRKVNCLALVRTGTEDKLRTRGGEPSATIDGFGCNFRSCYLYVFLSRMQVAFQGNPLPLVDLTGYKQMADISLTANMTDLTDVNRALAAYGLMFRKQPAELEMLVIRDRLNSSL